MKHNIKKANRGKITTTKHTDLKRFQQKNNTKNNNVEEQNRQTKQTNKQSKSKT